MKLYGAKFKPETAEKIDDYQAERDLNQSQAIRELVEEGLEASEPKSRISLPVALMWAGSLLLVSTAVEIEVLVASGYLIGPLLMALGFALTRPELHSILSRLRRDRSEAA